MPPLGIYSRGGGGAKSTELEIMGRGGKGGQKSNNCV